MDMLKLAMNLQRELQTKTYGKDIMDLPVDERIVEFRTHLLALEDELHEALAEMSWKPWAKAEVHEEMERVNELTLHFLFVKVLCLIAGMDADELFARYCAKRDVNIKRQEDGYDGVSTKDPVTKKALDEPTVEGYDV